MGELPHFRTAVGGFHKSDVSEYIAKIAKEHQNQLQEKDKEIQQLRQQLDEARDQLSQQAETGSSPDFRPRSSRRISGGNSGSAGAGGLSSGRGSRADCIPAGQKALRSSGRHL